MESARDSEGAVGLADVFAHLHVRSRYTAMESFLSIRDLCGAVARRGMKAVAVTDRMTVAGAVELAIEAKANGVAPIFGAELLVGPRAFPLVVLAETTEGWENLVRLLSDAAREGRSVISVSAIRRYSKGLIALSGGVSGEISTILAEKGEAAAKKRIAGWMEIFPGRFYLELQNDGSSSIGSRNESLLVLARKVDAPVVATGDVRRMPPDDLKIISYDEIEKYSAGRVPWLSLVSDWLEGDSRYVLHSPGHFLRLFWEKAPDALQNSVAIAKRCEGVDIGLGPRKIQEYPVEVGENPVEKLRDLAHAGLDRFLRGRTVRRNGDAVYRDRLEYELRELSGDAGYLLIHAEIAAFAKRKKIPIGPGRGSAVGSLLLLALGVTEGVDPIEHGLLLERFFLKGMIEPTICHECCADRRDEIFRYLERKYGKSRFSRVATHGRLKKVVADVLLPPVIHPSGFLLAAHPVLGKGVPLCRTNGGDVVVAFDSNSLEALGIGRFDLYSLEAVSQFAKMLRLLRDRSGVATDSAAIPLDDPKTYALISGGDTDGVFFLDSKGAKEMAAFISPSRFDELVAMMALFRPAPLLNGMVDEYVRLRVGWGKRRRIAPQLVSLDETYGLLVYQEQLMRIISACGCGPAEVHKIRRSLMKDSRVTGDWTARFLEHAATKGIRERTAGKIVGIIRKYGPCTFLKSHALACSLQTYRLAWMKANHPEVFAAVVGDVGDDTDGE